MNLYDFTLKFRLKSPEESAEKYVPALAENGCNDALIGIGQAGRISLNFTREATSALAAITSAIRDVKAAIPDAVLVEATPDFVGITDIAEIYGTSRQYIRKVVFKQAASFPEPVHEGKPSLWHLADVLGWVTVHEPNKLNRELLEVSELNRQINLYKSLLRASSAQSAQLLFENNPSETAREWGNFFRAALGYATDATHHRQR